MNTIATDSAVTTVEDVNENARFANKVRLITPESMLPMLKEFVELELGKEVRKVHGLAVEEFINEVVGRIPTIDDYQYVTSISYTSQNGDCEILKIYGNINDIAATLFEAKAQTLAA